MIRASSVTNPMKGLLLLILLCLNPVAWAAPAAEVVGITGTAFVRQASGTVKTLALNSQLSAGDQVSTEARSKLRLKFADGGLVTLRSNSQLTIESFNYQANNPNQDNAVLNLVKGGMRAVTGQIGHRGNADAYQAKNFASTIGIRGTEYVLLICGGGQAACNALELDSNSLGADGKPQPGLYFSVLDGRIILTNASGSQLFGPGQHGFVGSFNTPVLPLPRNPGLYQEYEIFSRLLNCTEPGQGCLVK